MQKQVDNYCGLDTFCPGLKCVGLVKNASLYDFVVVAVTRCWSGSNDSHQRSGSLSLSLWKSNARQLTVHKRLRICGNRYFCRTWLAKVSWQNKIDRTSHASSVRNSSSEVCWLTDSPKYHQLVFNCICVHGEARPSFTITSKTSWPLANNYKPDRDLATASL